MEVSERLCEQTHLVKTSALTTDGICFSINNPHSNPLTYEQSGLGVSVYKSTFRYLTDRCFRPLFSTGVSYRIVSNAQKITPSLTSMCRISSIAESLLCYPRFAVKLINLHCSNLTEFLFVAFIARVVPSFYAFSKQL
jgi:hypothetical protein